MFDGLLRRGLYSLSFFVAWLVGFKEVVWFFRQTTMREQIATAMRRQGFIGLAEVLEKVSILTFAHWRWTTLKECIDALTPFLQSICERIDINLFANAAEK